MITIKHKSIKKIVLSALFLAIGMVLPLLTSQIKEIGDTLLPMHIPVLLCGVLCGAPYGMAVGITLPFLRSVTFGMPPIYPNAVWMALELATYGLTIGIIYKRLKIARIARIYISLISAMIAGRIIYGLTKWILMGIAGKTFTFALFISGAFIDSLPGIIIQLIAIPLLINLTNKKWVIK